MSRTIAAIQTSYKGCRFRSRLEARWAVFMDALDWEWDYEPQGFNLNGKPYLPDFWVETIGYWIEVKPRCYPQSACDLLQELVEGTHKPALLLAGNPWPGRHITIVLRPGHPTDAWEWNSYENGFCDCRKCDGGVWLFNEDGGATSIICSCDADRCKWPGLPDEISPVHKAYVAARSARFEYGETGGSA